MAGNPAPKLLGRRLSGRLIRREPSWLLSDSTTPHHWIMSRERHISTHSHERHPNFQWQNKYGIRVQLFDKRSWLFPCRTQLFDRGLPTTQVHFSVKLCHNLLINLISKILSKANTTCDFIFAARLVWEDFNTFCHRTDIVMDVGRSLNPAIDVGQIEGAFVQGLGYVTMEEMVHGPDGEILNK